MDFGWGFLECDFFLTNIPLNEFSVIDFLLITYIVSLRKKILMTKKTNRLQKTLKCTKLPPPVP